MSDKPESEEVEFLVDLALEKFKMISEGMNFEQAMIIYAAACCATVGALSNELDEALIQNETIPDPERQEVLSNYPSNFVDILIEQGKPHLVDPFINKLNEIIDELNQ